MLLWDPVEVSREYTSVGDAHSPLPASQHLGQLQAQWDVVKIYCGTLVFREIHHSYTCCSASPWDWGQWASADLPGRIVMSRPSALPRFSVSWRGQLSGVQLISTLTCLCASDHGLPSRSCHILHGHSLSPPCPVPPCVASLCPAPIGRASPSLSYPLPRQ